jgi:hypothetical protein
MAEDSKETKPTNKLNYAFHKAGLGGVDMAAVSRKINEISKGSRFTEFQNKREEQWKFKANLMKKSLKSLSDQAIRSYTKAADDYAESLLAMNRMDRTFVHIDMDAFFAAVEMRERPELGNVPMVIQYD